MLSAAPVWVGGEAEPPEASAPPEALGLSVGEEDSSGPPPEDESEGEGEEGEVVRDVCLGLKSAHL